MWTRLVDTQTHTDLSNWQSTHHTAVNSSLSLHHHHWMHDLSKLESDPCEVAYVLLRVGRCSACRPPLFFLSRQWSQLFFFWEVVITTCHIPYSYRQQATCLLVLCQIERIQIYSLWPLDRTNEWWIDAVMTAIEETCRSTHTYLASY